MLVYLKYSNLKKKYMNTILNDAAKNRNNKQTYILKTVYKKRD